MKQMNYTYPTVQKDGQYFAAIQVPDDFEAQYPITATAIPAELQGKVVKYDWAASQWVDMSADADATERVKLTSDVATAQKSADTAQQTAAETQAAMLELSDAFFSVTATPDSTAPADDTKPADSAAPTDATQSATDQPVTTETEAK